jgi:hypothetical protein
MIILNTRLTRIAVLIGAVFCWYTVQAEVDPHWSKAGCQACHLEAAPVEGVLNLKASDAETLCETCHGSRGEATKCRHASDIPSTNVQVGDSLRDSLEGESVVCSTCHDVLYQCEHPTKPYSFMNPGFLRDRTSHDETDFCMKCHETDGYERLNPHGGTASFPPQATCQLCHATVPETSATGELLVTFNMQHDLNDTCRGCHSIKPHPKGLTFTSPDVRDDWVHLVPPTEDVMQRMAVVRESTGIELPLNPETGEIFCATCHNPHDFKVGGEHGSQSSRTKHRLRMNNICQACHEK